MVSLANEGTRVLIGAVGPKISAIEVDLAGRIVWTGPANPTTKQNEIHHEYRKIANGDYAVLRHEIVGAVTGDLLQEMAPDGSTVWSWDPFTVIAPIPSSGDWLHGNALDLDARPGQALYSAASLNALFAIDRATGKIVWRLGEGGSFAPDPTATTPWFQFQHDPEVLSNGHVLLFDNGRPGTRAWSRAIEYALDETTMKASVVWTYPSAGVSDPFFNEAMGSVQRMPNGNTVIGAGSVDASIASRVFEVTTAGTKVFEITVPPVGGLPTPLFRAHRIAPLVERIP